MTSEEIDDYLAKLPGDYPAPNYWMELYELLPDGPEGIRPPLPMVLGALGVPKLAKIIRFREHIEWADQNQGLPLVVVYLMSLPADAWEH